jgi:hypothetical protein
MFKNNFLSPFGKHDGCLRLAQKIMVSSFQAHAALPSQSIVYASWLEKTINE